MSNKIEKIIVTADKPSAVCSKARRQNREFWKSHIRRPVVLVGPSLGAAVNHPEAVSQKTLILWGEDDQIISNKLAWRLHGELSNARVEQISNCGHLPHVEKPAAVAKLIAEFVRETCSRCNEVESIS
ncbi:hypothetical protein ARALYDRAFT_334678 [Arabidopsis lyrata subsp. lyrata]|uniref:AB hydrolase-1 domain-containing protein n=1 Tax=Arabidopsis lyrata subsp. lyrata TaxID=81972 RepID=D7KQK4_ARALL|nr:hypothetical protein ARALYDRAFT_334678 [Arabidopsis lyrata subsp. lyrata]